MSPKLPDSAIKLHLTYNNDIMEPQNLKTMKLTPLDQIMVRGIVRMILCFPVPDPCKKAAVEETLRKALASTVKQMPFLSGFLRECDEVTKTAEVVYSTQGSVELQVKDVSASLPSYEALQRRQMPPSELKDDLLSPMKNMPQKGQKIHPVMAAQANFLDGGLLLCLCFHHSVLDGFGFATFLEMLGNNCKEVPDHCYEKVAEDNMRRREFLNLTCPHEETKAGNFPEYWKDDPDAIVADSKSVSVTSRLFYMTASSLANLKAAAFPTDSGSWISTHDALGALIWQCITRARAKRHPQDTKTKFCVFVNARNRIVDLLPEKFVGNICIGAQAELSTTDVASSDLAALASRIRQSLKGLNRSYVLGLINHINNFGGNVNCIKPATQSCLGDDITLVSWADFKVYDIDFGTLGKLDWFRCPWRTLDGTVKIMPERKGPRPGSTEEGFEVNVELREDDMARLLQDPLWDSYVQDILF